MNFKRIGRMLVCLLLVCCLIVNISPIRAEALAVEAVYVAAGIVITSCLIGIGLQASEAGAEGLMQIADQAKNFLSMNYNYITDEDKILVWSTGNPDMPYAVQQSLIDDIRSWLFDEQIIYSDLPSKITASGTCYGDGYFESADGKGFSIYGFKCMAGSTVRYYTLVVRDHHGNVYFYPDEGSPKTFSTTAYEPYYYSMSWGSVTSDTPSFPFYDLTGLDLGSYSNYAKYIIDNYYSDTPIIVTDKDLSLGEIAPVDVSLSDGYSTWAAGVTDVPADIGSEGYVTGFPVGLAPTQEGTAGLTQADVWNGVSTYEDTNTDISNPDEDPDSSGSTMSDITVTAFLGKLLADLTKMLFGTGTSTLTELFGSTWTEIQSLGSVISEALTSVKDAVLSIPSTIAEAFQAIMDSVVEAIMTGLQTLFVPSEGYLDYEVQLLRNEYPLADSFIDTGETFRTFFTGLSGEPPVIYLHLEDSEGQYDWGGTVAILDMNWYSRYKPTVDTLLSSLMWLFFIWRLLVHAPNIISGIAGDVEAFNSGPSGGVYTKDDSTPWLGSAQEYAHGKFERKGISGKRRWQQR